MSHLHPVSSRITPHFTWAEFLGPCAMPTTQAAIDSIVCLANRLQAIRDMLGRPVVITSGYRDVEHNLRVGGHPNSYHLRGMAADVVVPGLSAWQVQQKLAHWSGGLGCYDTFTHVDSGPKRRWGSQWPRVQTFLKQGKGRAS